MALISLSRSCVCSTQKDYYLPKPQSFSQTHLPNSLLSPQRRSSGAISRSTTHVVHVRKGFSSRTRRLENRGKKGVITTSPPQDEEKEGEEEEEGEGFNSSLDGGGGLVGGGGVEGSLGPMPELQGLEPDFWEGPQWDALGFFVQYLWAFGVVFALIACGIAVSTYNEGATDFKQTPVYKESIQSRDLLEEPEASNSDVFEANPTEEAPSLE